MKKTVTLILSMLLVFGLAVIPASALKKASEDFEGISAGESPLMLDFVYDYFDIINATPDSVCEIVNEGQGNMMRIAGFSDFRTLDYINGEYVFSVDVMMPSPGAMANVFVRGEMPGALSKVNPPNANTINVFNYYEWDWYRENGGDGASGIGGSGIYVNLGDDGFRLVVKKYAEDGLTVASDVYDIDYPTETDATDFVNVKFTDDGKEICVYIENKLGARAVLSENPVSYDSDETGCLYFASATVYDAEGAELGTTENTRIRFEGSQLAIATRASEMYVDNISLIYGEGAIAASEGQEPERTAAPTEEPTEAPTEAPETNAETNGGEQTNGETNANDTAAATKPQENVTTEAAAAKGPNTTVIIVIIAAVVVVAALVVIFLPKKKK